MNITKKIIITDTNIITDLSNAKLLEDFVLLNNVYISDLIKHDEININTGDTDIINKFKTIDATIEQLEEISSIKCDKPQLSRYDALNYIIARDNDGILATGDNNLKKYSEEHGIEVIRTLKIIELLVYNNIISYMKAINGCELLKNHSNTRIPIDAIDNLINKLKKDSE